MPSSKRSSCLGRLITSAISFVFSSISGALVIMVITWLYPSVNPALSGLLQTNQVPYASNILWGFWVVIPGLISMLCALFFTLIANRILTHRHAQREEVIR